jgi:hypothetical protein
MDLTVIAMTVANAPTPKMAMRITQMISFSEACKELRKYSNLSCQCISKDFVNGLTKFLRLFFFYSKNKNTV